jgi:diguanylate cyclase (GGDEF)-like protein
VKRIQTRSPACSTAASLTASCRTWCNAREEELPLAAVLVDINHFKQVNDSHGHAVGDRVLTELATLLG